MHLPMYYLRASGENPTIGSSAGAVAPEACKRLGIKHHPLYFRARQNYPLENNLQYFLQFRNPSPNAFTVALQAMGM
jgi:hypothetical protein